MDMIDLRTTSRFPLGSRTVQRTLFAGSRSGAHGLCLMNSQIHSRRVDLKVVRCHGVWPSMSGQDASSREEKERSMEERTRWQNVDPMLCAAYHIELRQPPELRSQFAQG